MTLYSRRFVGALRRRVRSETKQHPQWRAEALASRKSARGLKQRDFRWAIPLAAIGLASSESGRALALPILLAWSTTLMLSRASQIQTLVLWNGGSAPFHQFPVADRFVFQHAVHHVLRSSWWVWVDAFFFLATLALRAGMPEAVGSSLLLAAVSALGLWSAVLSGAITLVWLQPRFPLRAVFSLLLFPGLLGFWIAAQAELLSLASISRAYDFVKWCLPPGWVCVLIEPWWGGAREAPFLPLAPLAGVLVAAVAACRHFSRNFRFWPGDEEPNAPIDEAPEEFPPAPGSVEAAISSRRFLDERELTAGGFIERFAYRWLTSRERRDWSLRSCSRHDGRAVILTAA